MKRQFISGLLGVLLLPALGRATDAVYVNNGDITFPPQIDATNVINNGTFNFAFFTNAFDLSFIDNTTALPFETSNTQNFTNNGSMVGSIGFRFENAPSTGPRKMAANFRNRLQGSIAAVDGARTIFLQDGGNFSLGTLLDPSQLLVSATNLLNEGTLSAGAGGLLRLTGKNVNLTRSGVQIRPIASEGSLNGVFTNWFRPDIAIYDNYWGQTNQVMDSSFIIQAGGGVIESPPSAVQTAFGGGFGGGFFFGNATVRLANNIVGSFYSNTFAFTNIAFTNATGIVGFTNVASSNVVQAVFVGLPAANNVIWDARFHNSSVFGNPMKTVSVFVQMVSTNVVAVGPEYTSIWLVDTLAGETNRGTYSNIVDIITSRPQNYLLARRRPFNLSAGFAGNINFSPDLLSQPDFASGIVTNDYGAYSAFIDNIASRPPNIPAGTVTNLPGRTEIIAENLNMSKTRFRSDGLFNVTAKHLVSSSDAVVDCENLRYNLGSTNGNLKIQDLAYESVARLRGDNFVWSGVWTNYQNMVLENYIPDPADTNVPPIIFLPAPITNVVEVRLYAMVYDAGQLLTQVPVVVDGLTTHSTNVVVNDRMTIVETFLVDGQSFTLNGGITFSNKFYIDTRGNRVLVSLESWQATNAPTLKYFTNHGTLNIPDEAHFGDDRLLPYDAFVNRGTINAFGQSINSDYCELAGNNNMTAQFNLITRSGKVESGSISSGGDAQFYADVLKFGQATVATGSRLDFTVTNALFDSGGNAGNSFTCGDGFRLLIKPQMGDLLGTAVDTIAPAFAQVDHVWAGADRGATPAGFLNNTALGNLVLTPGDFEDLYPPLFLFAGADANNGLYVDTLDLSQLADYEEELQIEPNLVIYYAAAKLNFTPPPTNGAAQQPEEYLNGQFGGRLRWVSGFAGPNSSVAVVSNGVSIMVNKALRNSLIIDSNGNGIPNGLDFYPFNNGLVAQLGMVNQPPLTAVLSWNAQAQTIYQVQATTNYVAPNWQTVRYYTNTATTNGNVNVQITVPAGSVQQFYRVGKISP